MQLRSKSIKALKTKQESMPPHFTLMFTQRPQEQAN